MEQYLAMEIKSVIEAYPEIQRVFIEAETPELTVRLSDKYPNRPMYERLQRSTGGKLGYVETPVAADAVPAELEGMRTVFQGFHHLRPDEARAVLQNAAASGRPTRGWSFFPKRSGSPKACSGSWPGNRFA